jgi:hypothetical protein
MNSAQRKPFFKSPGSNALWINNWISMWAFAGTPTAGSAPGSQNGMVPTKSTTGAIALSNPGGSNTLYLGRMASVISSTQPATLVVYDRLLASSGFSNTATPVSPTVVNRTAPGDSGVYNNEAWIEVYTTPTAARTVTLTYTDQDNNTGGVSGTVNLGTIPSLMVPVPLAAGDSGVKSVQTVTCSGATGGDFGITILRRLAEFPLNSVSPGSVQDAIELGMPDIPSDACLAFMLLPSVASPGVISGSMALIQG